MRDEEERGQGADYEKLARCVEETKQELSATRAALEESRQQIAALADRNKEIALQVEDLGKLLEQLNPLQRWDTRQRGAAAFLLRWWTWFVLMNIYFWLDFAWTGQPPSLSSVAGWFIAAPIGSEIFWWLRRDWESLGQTEASASGTEPSEDDERIATNDENTKRKQSHS